MTTNTNTKTKKSFKQLSELEINQIKNGLTLYLTALYLSGHDISKLTRTQRRLACDSFSEVDHNVILHMLTALAINVEIKLLMQNLDNNM